MDNYAQNLIKLLLENDGFALGERHWTKATPRFLKDCVKIFVGAGATTFYTELVDSLNDRFLENYYRNPTPENLERIRPVLDDPHNKDEFLDFIKEAQRLGLRVVGIDLNPRPKKRNEDTKQFESPYAIKESQQLEIKIAGADINPRSKKEMDEHTITNQFWVDLIRLHRSINPTGKYIVHGGNTHMAGFIYAHNPQYIPNDTVPKLLGIPHVSITINGRDNLDIKGRGVEVEVPEDTREGVFIIRLGKDYGSPSEEKSLAEALRHSLQHASESEPKPKLPPIPIPDKIIRLARKMKLIS